jgi:hypothetical protein
LATPEHSKSEAHLENETLLSSVRVRELDLAVQAARTQQSRVERVGAVRRHDHLSAMQRSVGTTKETIAHQNTNVKRRNRMARHANVAQMKPEGKDGRAAGRLQPIP